MPSSATPPRWRLLAVATFVVTVAAATPSLPLGVRNWDNVVKLQLARNLLAGEGQVLTAPTPADVFYAHRGVDGRRYSAYPWLAAVLAVPTLLHGDATGRPREGVSALLLLGAVAAVVVLWGGRAGASPTAAAAAAMTVAFGTGLWAYAAHGYDVLMEVLALAVVLWVVAGEGRAREWLVAGLLAGAALATRYGAATLAVGAGAALLATARDRRGLAARGAAFAAGVAPGIALVLWWNWARFGAPLTVAAPLPGSPAAGDVAVPWLSAHWWEAVAGLTVSPGKGVVWYAPPVLAAVLLGAAVHRRARAETMALAAWAVAAVLFLARLTFWHGEWGWGPRYLAPLALAGAPLAWVIAERARAWTRRRRIAAMAAGVALVALQAVPVVCFPVESHLEFTVSRLAASGELATRPWTGAPVPADNRLLYFTPANSMIVSTARRFGEWVVAPDPDHAFELRAAILVPLAAALLVAFAGRLAAPRAAPAGEVAPAGQA